MTEARRPRKPESRATPAPAHVRAPAVTTAAREGLAWLHTARFLTTASKLDQLPQGDMPEIAFVGRSNAGKSSAINTLAQQRQLAFASKTPGRTQHINLFALGPRDAPDAYFADLPGYGYAAVARGKKLVWQKVMADYLEVRRALMGVVLMIDSRHGFTPLDLQLLDFIAQRVKTGEVKLLVLLTKADKLGKREAQQAAQAAQQVLGDFVTETSDIGVTLFSSLRRVGVEDVAEQLKGWRAPAPKSADADPPPLADADPGAVPLAAN
ncbi:MAG: ribosome biogenesis GTP-binding protein YihA/YsxC [Burkholderiaceae bacterium]